eukprot:jgi/Mesvir1/20273/Mv13506-RA.1
MTEAQKDIETVPRVPPPRKKRILPQWMMTDEMDIPVVQRPIPTTPPSSGDATAGATDVHAPRRFEIPDFLQRKAAVAPSELYANAHIWNEIAKHMDTESVLKVHQAFEGREDAADVRDVLASERETRVAKARALLRPIQQKLLESSRSGDAVLFNQAVDEFRTAAKTVDVASAPDICVLDLATAALEPTPGAWTRDHANALRLIFPLPSSDRADKVAAHFGELTRSAYLLVKGDDGHKSLPIVTAGFAFAHAYGAEAGIAFMCTLLIFFRTHTRRRCYRLMIEMFRRTTAELPRTARGPPIRSIVHACNAIHDNRRIKNFHHEVMRCVLPRGMEVRAYRASKDDYKCVRSGDMSSFDAWLDAKKAEIDAKADEHRATLKRVHAMMNEGTAGKMAYVSFKFGRAIAHLPPCFPDTWPYVPYFYAI